MAGKARKSKDPLQALPGVGPSIAEDLRGLGFREPADLHGADPEKMYAELCEQAGEKIDRCVLYVFRCAVYAVGTGEKDGEMLKWWNWKD